MMQLRSQDVLTQHRHSLDLFVVYSEDVCNINGIILTDYVASSCLPQASRLNPPCEQHMGRVRSGATANELTAASC